MGSKSAAMVPPLTSSWGSVRDVENLLPSPQYKLNLHRRSLDLHASFEARPVGQHWCSWIASLSTCVEQLHDTPAEPARRWRSNFSFRMTWLGGRLRSRISPLRHWRSSLMRYRRWWLRMSKVPNCSSRYHLPWTGCGQLLSPNQWKRKGKLRTSTDSGPDRDWPGAQYSSSPTISYLAHSEDRREPPYCSGSQSWTHRQRSRLGQAATTAHL